ncbi:hypothetical protein BJ165DRAFT_1598710 [Panaeolus papilionaceus]|nr:hypothetical protein BJ165DRAFT_1598710 [Panaeolus papilionaceus]
MSPIILSLVYSGRSMMTSGTGGGDLIQRDEATGHTGGCEGKEVVLSSDSCDGKVIDNDTRHLITHRYYLIVVQMRKSSIHEISLFKVGVDACVWAWGDLGERVSEGEGVIGDDESVMEIEGVHGHRTTTKDEHEHETRNTRAKRSLYSLETTYMI